jgi:hypothetical protein
VEEEVKDAGLLTLDTRLAWPSESLSCTLALVDLLLGLTCSGPPSWELLNSCLKKELTVRLTLFPPLPPLGFPPGVVGEAGMLEDG